MVRRACRFDGFLQEPQGKSYLRRNGMSHPYTEDKFVEQHAHESFAELEAIISEISTWSCAARGNGSAASAASSGKRIRFHFISC